MSIRIPGITPKFLQRPTKRGPVRNSAAHAAQRGPMNPKPVPEEVLPVEVVEEITAEIPEPVVEPVVRLSMLNTKAELTAAAEALGILVNPIMTKREILAALDKVV